VTWIKRQEATLALTKNLALHARLSRSILYSLVLHNSLDQGWPNYGQRAETCPANSLSGPPNSLHIFFKHHVSTALVAACLQWRF